MIVISWHDALQWKRAGMCIASGKKLKAKDQPQPSHSMMTIILGLNQQP